jgi:hypothetical protein
MLFRGKDGKLIEVSRFEYLRDDTYYSRVLALYDVKIPHQYTAVTTILNSYSRKNIL